MSLLKLSPELYFIILSFIKEDKIQLNKMRHLIKSKKDTTNKWIKLFLNNKRDKYLSYKYFVKNYTKCKQKNERSAKYIKIDEKVKSLFPNVYKEFINKLKIVESIRHKRFGMFLYPKPKHKVITYF